MTQEQRVAIITGSSSGIGAATAVELARRGWRVVINYSKSADKAKQVASRCAGSIVVQADVSKDADCRRMAKAALDTWGRIDALVNNAGTTRFVAHADLEGLSAEDFQDVYATNVVSTFQMSRSCAAALKASGRGAIVNVSSLASQWGTGSSMAYAASKGALNALTYSFARVLGPEVRVNAVLPGFVETPWHPDGYGVEKAAQNSKRYAEGNVLKATSTAEDVADAIVWLIEGAPRTTGETIFVDGGTHIGTTR
jgi:3-oxoacyl-[acyl-carrier protein] reductase